MAIEKSTQTISFKIHPRNNKKEEEQSKQIKLVRRESGRKEVEGMVCEVRLFSNKLLGNKVYGGNMPNDSLNQAHRQGIAALKAIHRSNSAPPHHSLRHHQHTTDLTKPTIITINSPPSPVNNPFPHPHHQYRTKNHPQPRSHNPSYNTTTIISITYYHRINLLLHTTTTTIEPHILSFSRDSPDLYSTARPHTTDLTAHLNHQPRPNQTHLQPRSNQEYCH
ncbi:hypothetical protein Peur_018379 [Populus x canadensis]